MSKQPPSRGKPDDSSSPGAASTEVGNEEYPVKFKFECAEINKRSVGKFMLKSCGNEGVADDEDNRLRRLLQGAITHLEKEKEDVWTNAEITIYDKYADCYIMKAGLGEYKFLVHLDGRDEIEVICTEKPSQFKKKLHGFASVLNPFNWFGGGSGGKTDGAAPEKASDESKSEAAKPTEQDKNETDGSPKL